MEKCRKPKTSAAPPEPACAESAEAISIDGLHVLEDFVTCCEEQSILNEVCHNDAPWDTNLSRRVQHFGFGFNYHTLAVDYTSEFPPIPPLFEPILQKLDQMTQLGFEFPLNQLTVNEYLPGQGISSHIDSESCFGPEVFILSLGSGITMTMQKKSDEGTVKKHLWLPRRSLLVLRREARFLWRHGIASRMNDKHLGEIIERSRRLSLTFRHVVIPGEIPVDQLKSSEIEKDHVFRVYDNIAIHWNHTRGRRKVHWHRVKSFLEELPPGSILADVGSGDGKYFGLNDSITVLGCDRSVRLLEVSRDINHETFCCDAVKLPFRSNTFDAVICIAVLHHLGSIGRRTAVIRELVRIASPGGRILIQAWAQEQDEGSRRNFDSQDVFVPWKLQKRFLLPVDVSADTVPSQSEIVDSPEGPCIHVVQDGDQFVYQRYCHVFQKGELEQICSSVPNCRVVENGWDRGNWFVILEAWNDHRLENASIGSGGVLAIDSRHTTKMAI